MLTLLYRKMRRTAGMVLCLFIGALMAAGMMSTVPIYTDASLRRTLIKDMESYQLETGEFPGIYAVERDIAGGMTPREAADKAADLSETVRERVEYLPIPIKAAKTVVRDTAQYISVGGAKGTQHSRFGLAAMNDIENHTVMTSGRMFAKGGMSDDGAVEAIATKKALKKLGISVGGEYALSNGDTSVGEITVRVTGSFEQSIETDMYWSETLSSYQNCLITDYGLMLGGLSDAGRVSINGISVRYALDYSAMDMNDLGFAVTAIDEDTEFYPEIKCSFGLGVLPIWKQYAEKAGKLGDILRVLQIPSMVMLTFYIFMVSKLSIEQEKNEISVFKSRGASSAQIFVMYALETGLIAAVSFVIAPFIGLALCRFIGISDGFLEFVNRTGISAKITPGALLYALAAELLFFAATMIPVIPASRLSVVQYKQSRTKAVKTALWEKTGIDLILIAAAVIFYIVYTSREAAAEVFSGDIDPLLFVFPILLIFGLGLLFVRIYPYLLGVIYRVFRPLWPPPAYMAITTVCRSQGGRERFLMMFLAVTFSLGIFSANTARTINGQKEDRIRYSVGADVAVKEFWRSDTDREGNSAGAGYIEPEFDRFTSLKGVETATKVMINKKAKASSGKETKKNVTVMAVEPYLFANTAWFRDDLLPVHWWNYIKLLQEQPSGVLISRALADKLDIRPGDSIDVKWSGNDKLTAPVLATVDYWPGINPNSAADDNDTRAEKRRTDVSGEDEEETAVNAYAVNCFVVMNYYHISQVTEPEPYEVWMKLKDGASREALYADIKAKKIPVEYLNDASQQIIAAKNDPQLQGMNGSLTLGFTVIAVMSVIGTAIYQVFSIKSRTLGFGILRAMGMKFREVIAMIVCEQLLVSGVSLAVSFVIGGVACDLFVPLFRSMYSPADRVPPFVVMSAQSDHIKLYILIALIFAVSFALLFALIKKININKALKLGED